MRARLTQIQSSHRDASSRSVICLIPGGPGMTSATLRSMDILSRSFDLIYVDTPGAGMGEEPSHPTFDGVVLSIEQELLSLRRPIILLAHSFGGLLAVGLAERGFLQLAGFVAIGTPMSHKTYEIAAEHYRKYTTPELRSAEEEWERNPSQRSLARLFSTYRTLYFSSSTAEAGSKMLLEDPVSWKTHQALLPVISQKESSLDFAAKLRTVKTMKYLVGGELDLMLPPSILKSDSTETECRFVEVHGAGHFVTFDQPEAVARLIEESYSTAK